MIPRWRFILPVLFAGLAAGCSLTKEEQRARDEDKCRSYGFTRQNDAFAACLQRIDLDRRSRNRYQVAIDPLGRPIY